MDATVWYRYHQVLSDNFQLCCACCTNVCNSRMTSSHSTGLSYQCLKLAVVCDSTHAEAYNNLGALEHRKENYDQANAHYAAATDIYEAKYNAALLAEERGDFQACFTCATAALDTFEEHADSKIVLDRLQKLFLSL